MKLNKPLKQSLKINSIKVIFFRGLLFSHFPDLGVKCGDYFYSFLLTTLCLTGPTAPGSYKASLLINKTLRKN